MDDARRGRENERGADQNAGAPQGGGPSHGAEDSWNEVGEQLRALGDSLARAFRETADRPQNRQRVQDLKATFATMAKEVGDAITDAVSSPEVERLKAEADRTGEALRAAGERAAEEVKPQIVAGLKQVTDLLDALAGRMESGTAPKDGTPGPDGERVGTDPGS